MIVEEIMNKNVVTLKPTNTILDAINMMRSHRIRHIPITNDQKEVVGIVTERDVKDAAPSIFQREDREKELLKPLELIMSKDVIVGHPLDFVEETAALFYDRNIGCLPIIKENKIVGIISETDLLYTLVELTGALQPGSQIEVRVRNKAGALYEVAGILRKNNTNIHSVLVYPDRENEHYKILTFRVQTMNPLNVIEDLKKEGLEVRWPNSPGIKA
jgi:acetoin utilization protein AcuB